MLNAWDVALLYVLSPRPGCFPLERVERYRLYLNAPYAIMVTVAVKELSPSVALIVIEKGRGGTGCPGLSLKRNCALTPGTGRAKSEPLFTTGGSISNTFGVTFRMTGGSGPIIALRVTVPVARSPLRIASGAMEKDASWPGAGTGTGAGAAPSLSLCSHVSPRSSSWAPSRSAGKTGSPP